MSKVYQQKPALYQKSPLWRTCKLQTFFAENRLVRYFAIVEGEGRSPEGDRPEQSLSVEEQEFFWQQDADVKQAGQDATAAASTVHGFESHRSAVIPWLDRRTGIMECIRGLNKDQIQTLFAQPKKDSESEPELVRILAAMDEVLTEAHGWCADGPECMLTWPRQLALGRFYTAVVGKARGFEPKKEPWTLKTNFGYWKQFLAYYYRIIYLGGHFTPLAGGTQRTPADIVQLTEA